jgi:hypothetical protein
MRGTAFCLALMVGAMAAQAQTEAKPATGVEAMRAYAGTWSVETEHYATAQSKAGRERTMLRNDCWISGAYFACNQYVDGDSKVLLVFTYDAAAKVYHSYQIPAGGAEPGHGTMTMDGAVWTFPWQMTEGGVTTYFRVVNVWKGEDRIEYRQEFSTDKAHWTLMAKGNETRISKP